MDYEIDLFFNCRKSVKDMIIMHLVIGYYNTEKSLYSVHFVKRRVVLLCKSAHSFTN